MDIQAQFKTTFNHNPQILVRAPGRVNLIGEHVDYNQGPVMPIAIDRYVTLIASSREDDLVHLIAHDLEKEITFDLSALESKSDVTGNLLPHWAQYPAGVAWALKNKGHTIKGINAIYTSTIPTGAGLSSSAAIEVAFGVLWNTLSNLNISRMELAQICQHAENAYVGVACGLMDQFASLFGEKNHAIYFDTRSYEWEPLPLPPNIMIIIADTKERHHLVDSAYNERRQCCENVVNKLKEYKPEITSLRDLSLVEFAAYSEFLPKEERPCAEHVVREISRVESVRSALKRGDEQALEALLYAGHTSLQKLYKVSTPALDTLVNLSRNIPGCIGARMTGAGFGGCTLNLVHQSQEKEFINSLTNDYKQQTGKSIDVYVCQSVDGAKVKII